MFNNIIHLLCEQKGNDMKVLELHKELSSIDSLLRNSPRLAQDEKNEFLKEREVIIDEIEKLETK